MCTESLLNACDDNERCDADDGDGVFGNANGENAGDGVFGKAIANGTSSSLGAVACRFPFGATFPAFFAVLGGTAFEGFGTTSVKPANAAFLGTPT